MTRLSFSDYPHWIVVVVMLAVSVACDDGAGQAANTDERIGSTIEPSSIEVMWGEHVLRWHLDPSPIVQIGTGDHGRNDFLGHVAYATRLSSGEVLIADASTGTIAAYGPDGILLRREGGYGEGPREYGTMTTVVRLEHDRMLVWDQMRQQIMIVAAQPAEENTRYRLEQGPAYIDARHRLHAAITEGRYVFSWSPRSTPPGIQPGDTLRHPVAILHWDEIAAQVDTVLTLMGPLSIFNRIIVGPGSIAGLAPIPLGAQVLATGSADYIVASRTDTHEYHVLQADGGAGRIIRLTGGAEQPLVDENAIARYREERPDIGSVEAAGMAALLGERLPTHEAILLDGGHLWIELFQLPWERSHRQYVIVDLEREEVVAQLQVPIAITTVHDVHGGYLIGTIADEQGASSVVVHRVVR